MSRTVPPELLTPGNLHAIGMLMCGHTDLAYSGLGLPAPAIPDDVSILMDFCQETGVWRTVTGGNWSAPMAGAGMDYMGSNQHQWTQSFDPWAYSYEMSLALNMLSTVLPTCDRPPWTDTK